MSDELASTFASIQEFMVGVNRTLGSDREFWILIHWHDHYETIPPPTVTVPPPIVTTIDYTRLVEWRPGLRGLSPG
ncbi:hypothetical protein CK203_102041 [Vitis vinifera]|uniref:Uncharacterized protein n=1 Tax=Vitis vinifera TaxID=29760 RepID=A0A438CHC5_VITVI|nr:hypothetical protein CK203_102041 [Vitis vinifera]